MTMGENQSLRRHVRCRSDPSASAFRRGSKPSQASVCGPARGTRMCNAALLLAAIAAVLMGSATASLQIAEHDESEITALHSIGLSANEASSAPAPVAALEASQSSRPSQSLASSSSSSLASSGSSDDNEIVARMPIDIHSLALDEGSFSGLGWSSSSSSSSSSGDQSGSSSGNHEQSATATIVFLESLLTTQSGSSNSSGNASGAGESEVAFPNSMSSRSDSGSGSGRAQDGVGFLDSTSNSSSGSSSSGRGDSDVGFEDRNATPILLSSDSDSGSGSSIVVDAVEFEAVLTSSYAADKQDADKSYSLTIEPVATTAHFASAVTAGSDSESTGLDSASSFEEVPEADAPSSQMHGVPSNPTLVSAVAHDGRAEVTWKTPDDDGSDPITAYEVSWFDEEDNALVGTQVVAQIAASLTGTKNVSSAAVVTNSSTSTASTSTSSTSATTVAKNADILPTFTVVSHLLNGKSYTFKVRAKNVNGFSVWSAKSLAVSPLHPPDLCGRISCSGRGTCFPNYRQERTSASTNRKVKRSMKSVDSADDAASSLDAQCFCRPGFRPPDCSVKDDKTQFVWKVSEWSSCSSGCGGGKRSREATCWDLATDKAAAIGDARKCVELKKPSLTGICNGMECGSKLVSVKYEVEMSYDEVLFSPEAIEAFELAFTTEVSAALQIPRTRLEVTALKRGSIAVFFQILPASRVGEKSLNDIVEQLQDELENATSTLRSKGTFARRVEPNGVKLSFSLADQSVQGGAEDISILGLIGTVLVLCFFVFAFGWSLRRRHQRILKQEEDRDHPERVLEATKSDMKRMGIRTMA